MKRFVRDGSILFAAGMLSLAVASEVIPQQIRDHRSHPERVPANRGSTNGAVQQPSGDYYRTSYRPAVIPADLENFLNTRMTRFDLIAVSKDTNSGYYNLFFTPLRNGSRNYKVLIIQDRDIDSLLITMLRQRWRLLSVTSSWEGARGLMHLCFFKQI